MSQREYSEPVHVRELVTSLAQCWTDSPAEFVRNFTNLVYRIPGNSSAYLRITPETHRSTAQIKSELEIIRHVSASGVAASQPELSRHGELIHTATMNDVTYSACVFAEAPGAAFEKARPPDVKVFFRTAGRTMGLLHEALVTFEQPHGFLRFPWTDDRWSRFAEHVPKNELEAWELFAELQKWTAQLSTDPSLFGLIHGDFTIVNMRIDGPQIALFDFDASCKHWRAYEIATFLHYFGGQDAVTRELAYESVLNGYAEVRSVTPALIEQIPLFGKMRLLYSFLVFAEEWGFDRLDTAQQAYFELRRRLFRSPPTWPDHRTI